MPERFQDLDDENGRKALQWIDELVSDPEVGSKLKRVVKERYPQVRFPDVDLEDRVHAKATELEKRLADFEASQRDKENKAYWENQRKQAKSKYELTDEDTQAVEKFMIEKH